MLVFDLGLSLGVVDMRVTSSGRVIVFIHLFILVGGRRDEGWGKGEGISGGGGREVSERTEAARKGEERKGEERR